MGDDLLYTLRSWFFTREDVLCPDANVAFTVTHVNEYFPPSCEAAFTMMANGRTGVFTNPLSPRFSQTERMIGMKTGGNPSGPEALKA